MNTITNFPCMVSFEEDVKIFDICNSSLESLKEVGVIPAGTEVRLTGNVSEKVDGNFCKVFNNNFAIELPEIYTLRELTEDEMRVITSVELSEPSEVRCIKFDSTIYYGPATYFKPVKLLVQGQKTFVKRIEYGFAYVEKKGVRGYVSLDDIMETRTSIPSAKKEDVKDCSNEEPSVESIEKDSVKKEKESVPEVSPVKKEEQPIETKETDVLFSFLCDTNRKNERFHLFAANDPKLKELNTIFIFSDDTEKLADIITKFKDVPACPETYNFMLASSKDELALKKYILSKGFRTQIHHLK